jgi:hypothetical protein
MPLRGSRIGVLQATIRPNARDISEVKLSHTLRATSPTFDDPNLVSCAGLVPALALAERAGLRDLADEHLTVPTDKGANAGVKVSSLVAGMIAGADSIDDMALLRHGGMRRIFTGAYAPSTLGSFHAALPSATSASSTRWRRGSSWLWPVWPACSAQTRTPRLGSTRCSTSTTR